MNFKKFSMYNENEQTTASDGTDQLENSLDDETMKTAAELFFKDESNKQFEARQGLLSDFGTLPQIPYVLRPAIYKVMQAYADQQLEEHKQALRELINIAGYYHDQTVTYSEMPYKNWSAIIDKARKLL